MLNRSLDLSAFLKKQASYFLFGARGVGKTYLAHECLNDLKKDIKILEYDLLQSSIYEELLREPDKLRRDIEYSLESSNLFVFIDEIQKIPKLLDEVHSLIEKHKGKLRFLLSGSSARKLIRSGANLLAGRAISLKLYPLIDEEIKLDLKSVLRIGSLPGIVLNNPEPELSLRSYVSTYLKEEIFQEALVRRMDGFARFLEVAAQYHGEILNYSKIAKSARVSSQTVSEYFQILEDTLLGIKLYGWTASTHKQLRTTPKFYFFDNGVANVLRGELNIELKESSSRYGKLFEAWIIQQIHRINDYKTLDLKFSYWRTNNDQEIDLIISRGMGQPIAAIEIKSNTTPDNTEFTAFTGFSQEYPKVPKYCFCQTTNTYRQKDVICMNYKDGLNLLTEL